MPHRGLGPHVFVLLACDTTLHPDHVLCVVKAAGICSEREQLVDCGEAAKIGETSRLKTIVSMRIVFLGDK